MTVGPQIIDVYPSLSVTRFWEHLNLARRFTILALALSVTGTIALGAWVSNKVEQSSMAREASSAALYIGHFISPLLQELSESERLSAEQIEQLKAASATAALRLRLEAMKVWSRDGRLLYSSNPALIGRQFPLSGPLRRALSGVVASEFESPGPESVTEHAKPGALLEIYAPIRSRQTGEIIAVAEFYERADDLKMALTTAKTQSWIATGLVLIFILLGFSSLIRDGSRTIDSQKRELTQRIADLSEAMEKRKILRERIEKGARRVMEEHERFLRDVGSDLHDGPAQLISLALLRLDELNVEPAATAVIRNALRDAMRDIRGISAGLLLPNIEEQGLDDCLRATIRDHELKTGTKVEFHSESLPQSCPSYIKICLCRFVQEGLSNAFRHAGGAGQRVSVVSLSDGVRAEVSDTGPGITDRDRSDPQAHLGLIGLRGRVESLRGNLTIESKAGGGTTLTALLPLGEWK